MGAELWHHAAPWQPDPAEALLELQSRFVAETYDLPSLVGQHLESAREAVRATEAEEDEYGLLDTYREELAMLEQVSSGPLPEDLRGRIELIRRLYQYSGQGVGNILDVTSVSDCRDYPTAARLTDEEMERLVGTTRPTMAEARQAIYKVNAELQRGESVCFPYYDDAQTDRPTGRLVLRRQYDRLKSTALRSIAAGRSGHVPRPGQVKRLFRPDHLTPPRPAKASW